MNVSIRSVDLRIAIGEAYGFDFESRVRDSNSNSRAAIYFTKDQLQIVGENLGIENADELQKRELQDEIRRRCGRDPRGSAGFDWAELKAIVEAADISISDDCYYDLDSDPAPKAPETDHDPSPETGVWSNWGDRSAE